MGRRDEMETGNRDKDETRTRQGRDKDEDETRALCWKLRYLMTGKKIRKKHPVLNF
jgi:hypothetical protein